MEKMRPRAGFGTEEAIQLLKKGQLVYQMIRSEEYGFSYSGNHPVHPYTKPSLIC
jgi:hypothetical protein